MKRLENQPFALLGVDSDNAERFRAAVKEGGITWPNWFDGGTTTGPIVQSWHAGPLGVYVLDAKGVIRYEYLEGEDLDKAVDQLLAEMGGTAGR